MSYQYEKAKYDREVDEKAAEYIRNGVAPFQAFDRAARHVQAVRQAKFNGPRNMQLPAIDKDQP